MGRAHSKTRAQRETYHRAFTGILCRPPKGMRWTKPSAIVDALELLAIKKGETDILPLLDYARKVRDTIVVKPLKRGQSFPNRFPTGNKGNVFLEYAWAQFNKHGRIMSEQDIMAAHDSGKIFRWYDSLEPRPRQKVETVGNCTNPKKLKRLFKQNAKKLAKGESEAEKAKRIGDEFRADMESLRKRQSESVAQYKAEKALLDSFKAMVKGA